jgi:hypothetical protein
VVLKDLLSDSISRLVKGSAKLEPELLDELGIFTRIEPAVQKYASSLNRAVSSGLNFLIYSRASSISFSVALSTTVSI